MKKGFISLQNTFIWSKQLWKNLLILFFNQFLNDKNL